MLAVLMFVSSTGFALFNRWIGISGWIAVAATISSALATTLGLLRRNEVIAAFVKIGFGVSGLAAPAVALVGVILGLLGYSWGMGGARRCGDLPRTFRARVGDHPTRRGRRRHHRILNALPDSCLPDDTNPNSPKCVIGRTGSTTHLGLKAAAGSAPAGAAENYLRILSFSRQGLIDQLSSDFGDQFTLAAATHGATQVGLC